MSPEQKEKQTTEPTKFELKLLKVKDNRGCD